MDLSVVAAAREDERPPKEALTIASHADRLGYGEVWLGEGPTWDSFALATAVGLITDRISITVGPVPVSVRDPVTIVRGAANAESLTGRSVGIALGTASTRVVEDLHGRSRARAAAVLADSAAAIRPLTGGRGEAGGSITADFRRRLPPPTGPLTIAAFGDRAIAIAAEHADRMLVDLVSPEQVRVLRSKLEDAARALGRMSPRIAAWLPAAVDPTPDSLQQILRSLVGYLTVRGYREMFIASGFGEAVDKARDGADRGELVASLPADAARSVGLVGDIDTVVSRLDDYADAGLDEVAIVPATEGDPGGEHTLTALATAR